MNNIIKILHPMGEDAHVWKNFLAQAPSKLNDIQYSVEYAMLQCSKQEKLYAAFCQDGEAGILYPFLLHPIYIAGQQIRFDNIVPFEIRTPYGMGGPLYVGPEEKQEYIYSKFDIFLREWANQNHVVAEFLCPHIFCNVPKLINSNNNYTLHMQKQVVAINLSNTTDEMLRQYRSGHRYDIKVAQRANVTVRACYPTNEEFNTMLKIYNETMDRHDADQRWYYQEEYFKKHYSLGKDNYIFFIAEVGKHIAAWALIVYSPEIAYYHFAGSVKELSKTQASKYMVHFIAQWAKQQGCKIFHLGGGNTTAEDDPLLNYKKGFSKDLHPFYIAYRSLNNEIYERVCAEKIKHEKTTGYIPTNINFFPLYKR